MSGVEEILTVTNRDFFFKTEEEYREVNDTDLKMTYILEPFGRNTAAAIAVAALHVEQIYGENAMMLILPADHVISDQEAFSEAVSKAIDLAQEGKLVVFGIQPERAETGYGYIETDGHNVQGFVEKPSLEKAIEYCDSGKFLWNSGMFCFSIRTILREMKHYSPEIFLASQACIEQSHHSIGKDFTQIDLDEKSFKLVPEDSIDYALIEKSKSMAVVPCSIGWSDIGSWNALGDLTEPDAQGNRIEGEALVHDVTNCYILSKERMVGAVGLDNLIIIDTPDALLVADKSRVQDVKRIYSELKEQEHDTYKLHRTVHRPWGTYTVLEKGPRFKIKRIEVKPGASLSLQMHHHRSEHWIVVSGMAKVINGEKEMYVNTNESTFIPAGHKHRLENPGLMDLVMIEVQSGEYMGEDDIVRFEDVYGRV
ncbi:mannose-1-phosphate guanylyltransferase/mannose-6-phosphate isomerase [Legionella antarctica]|uniref:mannose-1-phosphate guanylyltransferase n=1 Tax=Legionella antarctica TaxID=2708020 RepID=A0A6F8T3H0_9GAMM|nr:mannose-1-phosphate guanylyltransferase/mannose-6-phosphate isomerase [Legionella antarctica]